jgi:Reverse transcriptase (RNA-dependent DNA polymerase)
MFTSRAKDKSLFKHGGYGNTYLSIDFTRLSIRGFIHVMKSSNKDLLIAHSVLIELTLFKFARGPVWMFHFDLSYRMSQYQRSQLWHAICYRSFSSESRSDVRVVEERWIKSSSAVCVQKLLFSQAFCEARQTYIKEEAESLFKLFNHKIDKASKTVQKMFTFDNIYNFLVKLEFALFNHSHTGYFKFNLYSLFCDPCFLFYCYVQLIRKKSMAANSSSIQKVTFLAILLLSKKLVFQIYKPKPTRRVFVRKLSGKMRSLVIISSLDQIVQKAILILLKPVFEKQFLKCSHGFRENKSCHTCLSNIYYTWTGTKWFIEAGFLNCFERISCLNLMCLINKHFHNYGVSQIIHSMLKVGCIHFGNTKYSGLDGTFGALSSSFLSLFFCNILLHELDVFVVNLCHNFSYNKKIIFSKDYIK